MVSDISNATCVDAVLAGEEHQYVAIDRRTADGASLDVTSRLKHFPKRRHARLPHEENKAAGRSMTPAAFAMLGPDSKISGCGSRYRFRATPQRNSLVKLNAVPRVNSGTGGGFA
jgi:hypothetical protein